jgi:hypothetical protein
LTGVEKGRTKGIKQPFSTFPERGKALSVLPIAMPLLTKPPSDQEWAFVGFQFPNTTPIPDQLIDELLPLLSGAEVKVVLYICRRTFGFKKQSDNISLNQMLRGVMRRDGTQLDRGVGLSKPTLLRTLKSLSAKNVIIAERRGSLENGNEPTNYRLHMVSPLGQKMKQGADHKCTKPLIKKVTPQQTGLQNIKIQQQTGMGPDVVVALTDRGIAKGVAQWLANHYSRELILEKIEFLTYLKDTDSKKVKNPQGWLRRAIEEDYAAPDGYQSLAEREAEAAEKVRQAEAIQQAIAEQEQRRREEQQQRQQEAAARLAELQQAYGTTQQEQEIWQQVLEEFKVSQSAGTFAAYLAGTVLLSLRDGEALIGLPNAWMRDWVENRLSHKISQSLARYLDGQKVTPTFIALSQGGAPAGER